MRRAEEVVRGVRGGDEEDGEEEKSPHDARADVRRKLQQRHLAFEIFKFQPVF